MIKNYILDENGEIDEDKFYKVRDKIIKNHLMLVNDVDLGIALNGLFYCYNQVTRSEDEDIFFKMKHRFEEDLVTLKQKCSFINAKTYRMISCCIFIQNYIKDKEERYLHGLKDIVDEFNFWMSLEDWPICERKE